ncbi:hypothetical protein [Elizabethkingia anophelis]|uniref:hypothetical protein n=1 Tax=Elizabethkingia anophelis TaxID=1117645 RepID=UPI000DDB2616|nr:hypothetical protein [Elizabethkingia anophelis]MDV3845788.1 hypothetical protein [Elizabethkingia anophelis]RBA30854.1 hypothetical protein DSC50_17115 [Elizabethkingia anophelis]
MRDYYPFKLGEQYEKWEFDLEILDKESRVGCDSYIYLRTLILFGERVEHVEMIFSMDILIAVLIKFNPSIFHFLICNMEILGTYQVDFINNILFYESNNTT